MINPYIVRWVIKHADGGEDVGAHLISNAVTDEANEMSGFSVIKTYLEVKNRITAKEYNVQVKVTYSIKVASIHSLVPRCVLKRSGRLGARLSIHTCMHTVQYKANGCD
jgi:hypothetical protein